MINYDRFRNAAIKIDPNDTQTMMATFREVWNETYADHVFSYQFLDERIARFYEQDTIMLKLVEGFAFITIIISCLGLYGLVSFRAVRKTKEIGIRKVQGARVDDILWLFGKEFIALLGVAVVIAAPIAWSVMNNWLEKFTYRIEIGAGVFIQGIAITFIVAIMTVGYHSLRSALTNPVNSLRQE